MVDIVVARYNENVDWAYEFENVYIYDKSGTDKLTNIHFSGIYVEAVGMLRVFKIPGPGEDKIRSSISGGVKVFEVDGLHTLEAADARFQKFIRNKPTIVRLRNVGRESHTYLHHIIERFDTYEVAGDGGAVVFLQGHPFDHSPNILENLRKYIKDWKSLLAERKNAQRREGVLGGGEFAYLGESLFVTNIWNPRDHKRIKWAMRQIYVKLFECKEQDIPREDFEFYNGAQFVVSKNTILCRNIEFYKKMIQEVCDEVNPRAGFVFERLWAIVFKAL